MVSRIPTALRDRLGDEGTFELLELLQTTGQHWSEQVLSTAAERFERQLSITAERFERRLTQEMAALRVEMAQVRRCCAPKCTRALLGLGPSS